MSQPSGIKEGRIPKEHFPVLYWRPCNPGFKAFGYPVRSTLSLSAWPWSFPAKPPRLTVLKPIESQLPWGRNKKGWPTFRAGVEEIPWGLVVFWDTLCYACRAFFRHYCALICRTLCRNHSSYICKEGYLSNNQVSERLPGFLFSADISSRSQCIQTHICSACRFT